MVPLYFRPTDLVDFWLMPWSEPLRNACCWIALLGAPLCGKKPDKDAARWLRPLFVQRWVGQAVAERLAWLRAHPEARGDRFGDESDPGWDAEGRLLVEWRCLRRMEEADLRRRMVVELERLTRIAEEAPALVGGGQWTEVALASCAQIARLYAELKRRHRAERARALVARTLRQFVVGEKQEDGEVAAGDGSPLEPLMPGAERRYMTTS